MTTGYWIFLILIIPVLAAGFSFHKFREISIKESLISLGVAIVLVVVTMVLGTMGLQTDTETHSGYVTDLLHTPRWEAEWVEMVTTTSTDSKGRMTSETHTEIRSETHEAKWTANTTIGSFGISKSVWDDFSSHYEVTTKRGHRPDYDSGDRNDYLMVINNNGYYPQYPVSSTRYWQNKYKNTDSIVVGEPLSDEEALELGLPTYPTSEGVDLFTSKRIIGKCGISIRQWDRLNVVVGRRDHANLILVNMVGSMDDAILLKRYWQNGKKNDLVICVNKEDKWAYVFGWSKTELVKQNLTTIVLDNPLDEYIITLINEEMRQNFQPFEWDGVEDISVPIPSWLLWVVFILMLISQGGLYYYFNQN